MNRAIKQWKHNGKYFNFESHNIFYLQEGNGANLLIIHGYPYNSFEWKDTINELSKTHRVTIFDLLGMGFSDKPKIHKYCFEEYCNIINALLQKLNISETHIISHDLGVSIAQELIARASEGKNNFKIKSSAFINGSLFIDVYKPRLIQKLLSKSPTLIGKILSKILTKNMVNNSVKSVFGPFTKPSEAFLDQQWESLNYNDGKAITYRIGRLVFEKYNYLKRWVKAMQETTIPMCYICGPYDPNSGMHMAKRYAEIIPNPKVYFLDKYIGHWPQLEDQHNTIKYFYQFINEIEKNHK
jgi:pimeloyl-ACP methyl ester carboxylesterase